MKKGFRKLRIPCALLSLLMAFILVAVTMQTTLANPEEPVSDSDISVLTDDGTGTEETPDDTGDQADLEEPTDESVDTEEPTDESVDTEEPTDESVDTEEPTDESVDTEYPADESVDPEEAGDPEQKPEIMAPLPLQPIEIPENIVMEEHGAISGLLWVDGNGALDTDWDGLYNAEEKPLAGYDVYMYEAGNLSNAVAVAQTDGSGAYAFENLNPGEYILGIASSERDGNEYMLPLETTADCKFAAGRNDNPFMAYTEVIALAPGQAVEHISAGMRLKVHGAISGLLWVDGDGTLDTDWDGMYNADEEPLAGYSVFLYKAGDTSNAIAVAQTNDRGVYIFEELNPGEYLLGIESSEIDGNEYLPPDEKTADCGFEIDREISPLAAYTEVMRLGAGETAEEINAGMRLAATYAAYNTYTIDEVEKANKFDAVTSSGNREWIVIKTEKDPNTNEKYVYLLLRNHNQGGVFNNLGSTNKNNYNNSALLTRMQQSYFTGNGGMKDVLAKAVKPTLGDNKSQSVTTKWTKDSANGSNKNNVFFAPSFGDMKEFIGLSPQQNIQNTYTIPAGHRLADCSPDKFFCRTAGANDTYVCGVNISAKKLDTGMEYYGSNGVIDAIGVWVKASPSEYKVKTHYVNDSGDLIGPSPNPGEVTVANNACFQEAHKDISNYIYLGYKWDTPPADGSDYTDGEPDKQITKDEKIYYVYKLDPNAIHTITIYYVDTEGNLIGPEPNPDTATVIKNEYYKEAHKLIADYDYLGYKWDSPPANDSDYTTGEPDKQITKNEIIYYVYNVNPGAVCKITVYRVDTEGNLIGPEPNPDTATVIKNDYYKEAHKLITDYDYLGYKWDSPPANDSDYTAGEPDKQITKNEIIYYVYKSDIGKVNVTLSKKVEGFYIDTEEEFTFLVSFMNKQDAPLPEGTSFKANGGTILTEAAAPANETLVLNRQGLAVVTLKHGQSLTILDVPGNVKIMVIESLIDDKYIPTYTDSAGGSGGNITEFSLVGEVDRAFSFINRVNGNDIVPNGIADNLSGSMTLLLIVMLLILPGWVAADIIRKRISAK